MNKYESKKIRSYRSVEDWMDSKELSKFRQKVGEISNRERGGIKKYQGELLKGLMNLAIKNRNDPAYLEELDYFIDNTPMDTGYFWGNSTIKDVPRKSRGGNYRRIMQEVVRGYILDRLSALRSKGKRLEENYTDKPVKEVSELIDKCEKGELSSSKTEKEHPVFHPLEKKLRSEIEKMAQED